MTKKHFIAIAAIIKQAQGRDDAGVALQIALNLAQLFAAENPRFDRGRFLAACGF